ncbi:hypothetical protein [Paracnuella aquatica]|uniref:hypothetical protein n=1 Tax=Paracnuella aquatica TaxID=2268757 RepID=UPI000DEF2697|nr:hypothetical protein [Paracnuella aquatica]RPD49016.1 hypothetical protein DRJ53_07805 [Paracnuella aquatica]
MQKIISEETYWHRFVYLKADLTDEVEQALSGFISTRNLEQRVFLKSKAAASIHRYETILLHGEDDALTAVLVVEISGNHWQSFMQLLLHFSDRFPPGLCRQDAPSSFLNLN